MQKRDRSMHATNFKDLGIRHREAVQPPNYKSHKEFLVEGETSDEDVSDIVNIQEPDIKLPDIQ